MSGSAFEIEFMGARAVRVPLATASAAAIVRASFLRACWARTRVPLAITLIGVNGALWGAAWHEAQVDALRRDNAAMRALLMADRQQVTIIASGCGREQLQSNLTKASADLDLFRFVTRRAPQ